MNDDNYSTAFDAVTRIRPIFIITFATSVVVHNDIYIFVRLREISCG